MTDDHKPNLRETHGPLFEIHELDKATVINYDGKLFARIVRAKGLPQGYTERAVAHFAEMLMGTRSALWDEQATYGKFKRNGSEVRRRAQSQAAENLRRLEGGK